MRLIVCGLIGLVLFLAIDHVVFSNAVYGRWADPISTAGQVASTLESIGHMRAAPNAILVLGDSRMAEGFSVAAADGVATTRHAPASFGKIAVPGTTLRAWYYLLRDIALRRDHVKIVAIMMTSYHDDDRENLADRVFDIAFLHPVLDPLDLFDFPLSFTSLANADDAAQAILLKGMSYNGDLHHFLAEPAKRISDAQAWHAHGAEWLRDYPGHPESLAGLAFDQAGRTLILPRQVPPDLATRLQAYGDLLETWHGHPPENAASHDYRALWLPRIAQLCAGIQARLVIFRVPRGPLGYTLDGDEKPTGVVAQMAAAGQITLMPANLFDHLERPDDFFDELHLNAVGQKILSRELASALLDHLAPKS